MGLFCRLEFLEQDQGSARETYRGELATMEQRLRNTQPPPVTYVVKPSLTLALGQNSMDVYDPNRTSRTDDERLP